MSRINKLIDDIIRREGGYVDHPADRGGPTCWGITEATARAAGYEEDMQDLPRELAVEIYRDKYYYRPGFDRVAELAPLVAEELADTGVNMGPARASGFLQRCLNVLTEEPVTVDGQIGPQTLGELRKYIQHRGQRGADVLLGALNHLQGAKYIEIAERDPSQKAFIYGWLKERTE